MREFFKPWRRKFGCVTLAIACVCASGWMRGLNGIEDTVCFDLGERYLVLCFSSGWFSEIPGIWMSHCVYDDTFNPVRLEQSFVTWDVDGSQLDAETIRHLRNAYEASAQWEAEKNWEWKWGGFGVAGNVYSTGFGADYRSIVILLTLLSAYLLLTNSKQKSAVG